MMLSRLSPVARRVGLVTVGIRWPHMIAELDSESLVTARSAVTSTPPAPPGGRLDHRESLPLSLRRPSPGARAPPPGPG